MRVFIGIVVVVALLLLLAPLWGWIGALVYSTIAWLGQLFAHGELSDGRLAFRAGVLLGGSVSVLSLLRVAWQDRSGSYLMAAGMLGLGVFVTLLATSFSSSRAGRGGSTESLMEPPSSAAGLHWFSRDSYERDAFERVEQIARAAARGQLQRADMLLEELQQWPRRRPRNQDDRARYEQLWDEYSATFDSPPSSKQASMETRQKRRDLMRRLWESSRSNSGVGIQLLLDDMSSLHLQVWRYAGADIDAEQAEKLENSLRDVHALQQSLFAYEPGMPELWKTYAATIADSDEELALGALVVAGRLADADTGFNAYTTQRILLRSDLRVVTSLLTKASGKRLQILEARAAQLAAGQAKPAAPAASVDTASAEQAMPPAGKLTMDEGLWLSPRPSPPSIPPMQNWGVVQVDLPAAGFRDDQPGIILGQPGVSSATRTVLVLDVWKDGRITSVLVERSSGDEMLDQAARQGARHWKNVAEVPPDGERRRVTVTFNPPTPAGQVSMAPVGDEKQALMLLGKLLVERAQRDPARYPSSAARGQREGLVLLSVTLAADGSVKDVGVARSSGHPMLDEAAREAAWRWSVQPPEGAVRGVDQVTLVFPVRFRVEP